MSDQQHANDVQPAMIAAIRVRAGSNILNPLRYPIATNELEAKGCEKIRSTAEVDLDDGRTLVEEVFSIVETLEGLSDVTELSPVLSAGTAVVAQ
jgi:hypothetical protein